MKSTLILELPMLEGLKVVEKNSDFYDAYLPFAEVPKVLRAIRRLWIYCKLPFEFIWYGKWKKSILQYNTVIIFTSALTGNLGRWIKEQNSNIRIIYWYWNKVDKYTNPSKLPDYIEKWSFDSDDCQKYSMKMNVQYLANYMGYLKKANIVADVYYLGHDSGRRKKIEEIKSELEKKGLLCESHIIGKGQKPINYIHYINDVYNSNAILEVNRDEQDGFTLRTIEALHLEKKLITDNKTIKNAPFYSPQNIFILGEDNIDMINEFINAPYNKEVSVYKEDYTVEAWYNNFKI